MKYNLRKKKNVWLKTRKKNGRLLGAAILLSYCEAPVKGRCFLCGGRIYTSLWSYRQMNERALSCLWAFVVSGSMMHLSLALPWLFMYECHVAPSSSHASMQAALNGGQGMCYCLNGARSYSEEYLWGDGHESEDIILPEKKCWKSPQGSNTHPRGSGRPMKTSPRTDIILRREKTQNLALTTGDLKKMHPEVLYLFSLFSFIFCNQKFFFA